MLDIIRLLLIFENMNLFFLKIKFCKIDFNHPLPYNPVLMPEFSETPHFFF